MRGSALAILILALTVACTDNATAAVVSCDHHNIVARHLERRERYLELRQRYLKWRLWRRADVRERVHRWAAHELRIGVHETGWNTVPRYGVYGWEWCGDFAAFCVRHGEDGHPLPANPASTSSWRAAIRAEVRGLRRVFERRNVRPGDVVTFPYGHTGIVHKTHSGGFWSIEGNCTDRVQVRWHAWWEADTFGRVLFTKIPERFRGIAR